MELNYTLSVEDYLELQLYNLSRNENYKKQQNKDRFRLPGLSFLFGVILLIDGTNNILAYVFIASSILFFVFYKQWSAWFYKRMCKRKISEGIKDNPRTQVKLLLEDNVIEISSAQGQSRLNVHDINRIVETSNYYFILINRSMQVIVPKNQVVDKDNLTNKLKKYKGNTDTLFVQDLNWKWNEGFF